MEEVVTGFERSDRDLPPETISTGRVAVKFESGRTCQRQIRRRSRHARRKGPGCNHVRLEPSDFVGLNPFGRAGEDRKYDNGSSPDGKWETSTGRCGNYDGHNIVE